jgi:ElaB/YqjD/DUF883 family membrane-anchored ribosome-binding protein
MADNKPKSAEDRLADAADPTKVKALQAEELGLANILRLKLQIREADQQAKTIAEAMSKFSKDQLEFVEDYKASQKELETSLKEQAKLQARIAETDDKDLKKNLESRLRIQREMAEELQKEQMGYEKLATVQLYKRKLEADITAKSLQTERDLIKSINKERGIGGKIMDLFRSKERKNLSVDIARAKTGGGSQVTTGGKGGGGGGALDTIEQAGGSGALGPYGMAAAAVIKAVKAMAAPFKELGNQIKAGLSAPLADAAGLLTGDDLGMGGGKAKASGATSILGGLSSILSKIPLIGGILGGVVDMFKAMLDAVLGVEQANFRVGRALNISAGAADNMRKQFDGIAAASNNIVVNSTRMLQSQVEISKQLGTNKQLSADILVNDVKLRDILGLEAESRQQIAESSIVTGRNATKLTQGIIGTVGAFNKLVGTSFKFNDIIGEASKMSGVMGLTFAKYPEKLTKALLSVKTLGFELKQLDSTAESFLDFEGSISKEMEAQVLTGKEMNLTAAREAALNNDNAKLASEITKNVGDANAYLKMNRIQQEAIAQSVGMSRDSLADVLKKQTLYSKLGATDVETFNKKIELLEKQGKTQEQISAMIGKDAYNTYTQVSTAEKLSEVMERIKKTFVDFLRNSGLFEFITDPVKINNFIKGMADKLASTIGMIGEIIAMMLDGIGSLPFTDKEKWSGMAASVRAGTGDLSGAIRSSTNSLGGAPAGSISSNVEKGTRQQSTAETKQANSAAVNNQPIILTSYTTVDGVAIAKTTTQYQNLVPGQTKG